MNIQHFINSKSNQLVYYVRGFWDQLIPYKEVELFFWDTMEEWTQYANHSQDEPYSQKERAFWHLLHQLHFWPESKLRQDPYLKSEINACLECLEDKDYCPLDFIGIRP